MRTSIKMTSGSRRRAWASAWLPSPASPATREIWLGFQQHPQALADQVLVVGDQDADHDGSPARQPSGSRAHGEPAAGPRPGAQVTAEHRDPLAHPASPVPARALAPHCRGPGSRGRRR